MPHLKDGSQKIKQKWTNAKICLNVFKDGGRSAIHCFFFHITAALEQDEQARKQRLSYKVEQLISAMSLES
ncbi:unnamed protein product [Menidia menidia]|uniref:(Atlantic silverside) hypothetical protein n=1 Tax=Menidia menidia TaxID=238744 RepID=A0A8S4BU74_9TELE|nr:unnamed protein product [Menidia menidia]